GVYNAADSGGAAGSQLRDLWSRIRALRVSAGTRGKRGVSGFREIPNSHLGHQQSEQLTGPDHARERYPANESGVATEPRLGVSPGGQRSIDRLQQGYRRRSGQNPGGGERRSAKYSVWICKCGDGETAHGRGRIVSGPRLVNGRALRLAWAAELCSTEPHGFAGAYFSGAGDWVMLIAWMDPVQVQRY